MKTAMERTREYFDQILLEMRLVGSVVPDTTFKLYGEDFSSPIMTAALSHMGTFYPESDHPMVQYAEGAAQAGCVHWIGMCENEEFDLVMSVGARTIRIVKPYADEHKIQDQLVHAEKKGALAVGMDIDHMFNANGEPDTPMGEKMSVKSPQMLQEYIHMVKIPFIIKGVLSVHDAVKCAELGAGGIVVSHHNGRLKDAIPPLMVLPEIVKEVGQQMPVFVDCGICSGMDAYKALALGATAVSVGGHLIPVVRKDGANGVRKRLQDMGKELKGVMAYTGVKNLDHFEPTVIHNQNTKM